MNTEKVIGSNDRSDDMGFTGILVVTVLAIMILAIYVILQEIKARNWKKIIFTIVAFVVFILALWYGLICFITSM
jgi:multisubunit Na+/H+ antiporter MnhB subunit